MTTPITWFKNFCLWCADMSILCISVVFDGRCIIPWTINSIETGQTFLGLYQQIRAGSIESFEESASKLQFSKLSQAFVGQNKDNLIAVTSQLSMDEVCKQFGSYVRLKCEKVGEPQGTTVRNVFETMMMSQRRLDEQNQLPAIVFWLHATFYTVCVCLCLSFAIFLFCGLHANLLFRGLHANFVTQKNFLEHNE